MIDVHLKAIIKALVSKLITSVLICIPAAFVFGFLRMYGVNDLLKYERDTILNGSGP